MPKEIWMFVVTQPFLLKSTEPNPKMFFRENLQKIIEDLFKSIYVSLGATTSCILYFCRLKSRRVAFSVPFNVIEMV